MSLLGKNLLNIGVYLIMVGLWNMMKQRNQQLKEETATYLMWYFIGSLIPVVVSFVFDLILPLLGMIIALLFSPLPYILVAWQIKQHHQNFNIFEIFIALLVFLVVSGFMVLFVNIFTFIPSLLFDNVLLMAFLNLIVLSVSSYLSYMLLHRYGFPFLFQRL